MAAGKQAPALELNVTYGVSRHQPKFPPRTEPARKIFSNGPGGPPRPGVVGVARVLLWLTALMQACATTLATIYANSPQRRANVLEQLAATGGDPESVDTLLASGLVTVVVAGAVTVLGYVLLAHFLWQGRAWARTLGGAVAILTLVQLIGLQWPMGYATVGQCVFGAAAIALCYLPAPARYFDAVKEFRHK